MSMSDDDLPGMLEAADFSGGWADTENDLLLQRLCPDCNGSGYATTLDGRTLGTCLTCDGHGGERR